MSETIEKTSQVKRIDCIDYVRGLAICMIIAGHFGNFTINSLVFTVNVPIFLLISGYLYHDTKYGMKKYIKRFIVPYSWTIIILLLIGCSKQILKYGLGRGTFLDIIHTAARWGLAGIYGSGHRQDFLDRTLPVIGAVWFFWGLFWGLMFLHFVFKIKFSSLLKTEIVRTAIVIGIFLGGYWSAKYTWLPLSIQSGMIAVLFLYIGYIVRIYGTGLLDSANIFLIFICTITWGVAIYCSYKNGWMDIAKGTFPNLLINICGGCSGSYLIFLFCKNHNSGWNTTFFKWFGKQTDQVLCIHNIELNTIPLYYILSYFPNTQWIGIIVLLIFKIAFISVVILFLRVLLKPRDHIKQ